MIVLSALFATLAATAAATYEKTTGELLAERFSPILILTEDNESGYGGDGRIRVLKPEPVEIMGAQSAKNIWFEVGDNLVQFGDETWFNSSDVELKKRNGSRTRRESSCLKISLPFFMDLGISRS